MKDSAPLPQTLDFLDKNERTKYNTLRPTVLSRWEVYDGETSRNVTIDSVSGRKAGGSGWGKVKEQKKGNPPVDLVIVKSSIGYFVEFLFKVWHEFTNVLVIDL